MSITDFRANYQHLQDEINYRLIGQHMKEMRKAHSMTQSNVAEKMGMTLNYYTSLERGNSKISFARFIQFLCITGGSADALLVGCHSELPIEKMQNLSEEQNRQAFERLLSQTPISTRKMMFKLCETLAEMMGKDRSSL